MMSRTLFHRTNKEFDKCAQLLRNILTVQESRQDSKTPSGHKINRKKQTSVANKQNSKSSSIKPNVNHTVELPEGRLNHSPNKVLHPVVEENSPLKSRSNRKNVTSSIKTNNSNNLNSRFKSPLRSFRQRDEDNEELVRSSSCGDLPSSKSDHMQQQRTRIIHDQFLLRIQTLSKQIRMRYSHKINDPECTHLWNELENSLSSALSYSNDQQRIENSFKPLHNEINSLRKQLQTTSIHLHQYDLLRRTNDQYLHLQKKFDSHQIHSRQLVLHNEQLQSKCRNLQNKLDHLERNNIRLIQRFAQKDLCSISEQTEWISTENRLLLREEILSLRQKLYHVYEDLSVVLNRNQVLENSLRDQKQLLQNSHEQINEFQQSARELLIDLNSRITEEKIKRFLHRILLDKNESKPSTTIHRSTSFFEQSNPPPKTVPIRIRTHEKNSKLRPQSLFITPNVLNDSDVLSKLENHRTVNFDRKSSSSSTIDDADSTILSLSSSSLLVQQRKRSIFHHSYPSLIRMNRTENNYNESGQELDQISNLTSKIFGSDVDEEDLRNDLRNLSSTTITSSSNLSSTNDKFLQT